MRNPEAGKKPSQEAKTWIYLIVVLQVLFLLQMGDFFGLL